MKRLFAVPFLLLLLLPALVHAHGTVFTYKYIDGDNLVLVTHNVHDPQSGLPITYNLRLYTIDGQPVAFQDVEATVRLDGHHTHQQTLTSQNDNANFTYTYPQKGNYVIAFTFLDHDKSIARGEFPVAVAAGIDQSFFGNAFTPQTGIAFALGAGVSALAWTQRKRLSAAGKAILSRMYHHGKQRPRES